MDTIERYHGSSPIDRGSKLWDWHNNTFEKDTVVAGIRKHYTDPESLDLVGYIHYAGLTQALMLGYSLEAIRYKLECYGALFWMYNDCWGEVGWTIIDYYLDRKPSFYAVKRALAPRRIILRPENQTVGAVVCNDTASPFDLDYRAGFVSFDGTVDKTDRGHISVPAFERRKIAIETEPGPITGPMATGLFVLWPKADIHPAFLRPGPYGELTIPKTSVSLEVEEVPQDNRALLTFRSATYAHAVHPELPRGAVPDDDYFDLLPGESRTVQVANVTVENVQGLRVRTE